MQSTPSRSRVPAWIRDGLKQDFGEHLTFWGGGCDTHRILSEGSPQQIREHVRRQIEIFKPGGGFVFQQVHNILANVPPENVIAMLEAAHEFGGYACDPSA